jgi:hypothetical protein
MKDLNVNTANPNCFEKTAVRWQKLKKKRVNRQNYLRSTNVVLLLTVLKYEM